VLPIKITSRLMVSDVGAMLSACQASVGIAQIMQLGSKHIVDSGTLVELFPDWPGELFPLYALYPSRQHRAAKVRAFVDFAIEALTGAAESPGRDVNAEPLMEEAV
jgi:DNA-binding transcriptional LysR family regulator